MIKTASSISPANPGPDPNVDPVAAYKFACKQAWDENRDQWGRPKVMLPDGSRETGYRRSSSYGAPLEDGTRLELWKLRQVARGVSRRDALRLAITRAEVGLDGSRDEARGAKKELDDLCEQAMDAVESGDKASIGTSLHHVFELVDQGRDPGHVPEQWRPDLAAYQKLTRNFRTLSAERIVVQDDHRVGGTLDRAVECLVPTPVTDRNGAVMDVLPAGAVVIGDVKTSQKMDFAGAKFGVQCWTYATAVPYDPIKKQREDWGHEPPRTDWAVIFHVGSGTGKADLYWVDLTQYAAAASECLVIYEWRNSWGKASIVKGTTVEDFTITCEHATSEFDLLAAYERAKAAGEWNDLLKARFGKRKREIMAGGEQVAK